MDKFKKTLSFRKKKEKCQEEDPNNKPVSWQEDERKVREGCCSFQVKYLGYIEVFDSRGMQVCEEALKALRRPKKKAIRAILYVSGDTIRVSDEISKGLIVDQTIEKVSFCSPDRNHKKGFAYICRDGTTRRWMCHAFLAVKETGERLSHAVGCAFAICLEKKQKRESEVAQSAILENKALQGKSGSFRQASLTERLQDPQSAIIAEPPVPSSPHPPAINTTSPEHSRATVVPRPHASVTFFSERQTSLRMFPKLQESSPFKRELSLRLAEIPTSSQKGSDRDEPINEEESAFSDQRGDASGRLSAFSTFTKSLCASDNSANDSPAHTMSSSFVFGSQSDTASHVQSNPFLAGAINYGASSNYASQEAISIPDVIRNNSKGLISAQKGTRFKEKHILTYDSIPKINDSFQKLHVTTSSTSHPLRQSVNGFNGTNVDSNQGNWQMKYSLEPVITNAPQNEGSSTNPWRDSSYSKYEELNAKTNLNAISSISPNPTNNNKESSKSAFTTNLDPFDVSWINTSQYDDGEPVTSSSWISNNPFLM